MFTFDSWFHFICNFVSIFFYHILKYFAIFFLFCFVFCLVFCFNVNFFLCCFNSFYFQWLFSFFFNVVVISLHFHFQPFHYSIKLWYVLFVHKTDVDIYLKYRFQQKRYILMVTKFVQLFDKWLQSENWYNMIWILT